MWACLCCNKVKLRKLSLNHAGIMEMEDGGVGGGEVGGEVGTIGGGVA